MISEDRLVVALVVAVMVAATRTATSNVVATAMILTILEDPHSLVMVAAAVTMIEDTVVGIATRTDLQLIDMDAMIVTLEDPQPLVTTTIGTLGVDPLRRLTSSLS